MATLVGENGVPILGDLRGKRTEAMPKTSLFGSDLEIHDEQTMTAIRNMDPERYKPVTHRESKSRFQLPDDVKAKLPGAQVLEKSRKIVETQKTVADKAAEDLKKKEERALLFSMLSDGQHPSQAKYGQRHGWFTERDLEGSKDINVVGLNPHQSYNRDKYGKRAPAHQYKFIGDVFRPGMDFPRRERSEIQMRNQGYGKGDLRGALRPENEEPQRGSISARSPKPSKPLAVDLPMNIKHAYGSKVCDKLLSDSDTVEKTIKKQNEFNRNAMRKSQPFEVPKFTKDLKPEYEMLGNALRMNVVPGYTMNHKISTTKTSFNDQVHLFRIPDPDKWRYQRDELSTWNEHQVLRNRLVKKWNAYLDSSPKAQPNWERGALRPKSDPNPAQPTQSKQKPKQPKKKTTNKIPEPSFEEVKFETPPLTPQPQSPGPAIPQQEFKRDDEFWNFYEKS